VREEYGLEYGEATLEIATIAIKPGARVLIVDDLLATGGTVRASANLVEKLGGVVVGVAVLAELAALNGRAVLSEYQVASVIVYE
jgi:adenine phosphoribosyltransferase